MRVLQVINSLGTGGAEKLLLDAIPKFREKGVEMDLLLLNGTEYPFLEKLKQLTTGNIYSLGNGSVYKPTHIFKIVSFLKRYDLVHVHLFPSLYWTAFAKSLSFSRTLLVYTEHNTSNRRREKLIFKWLDRFVYKRYARIITIAEEVDNNLKEHLGRKGDVFSLIPNGIDIDAIQNVEPAKKEDFGLRAEDRVLLQVSSFTPQKDQITLIKALAKLPHDIKLLLVGKGPTQEACEALVEELNLQDRVQFLGVRMDIPQLLKMADVVVLSSHYEGLSLSSIEGLSSGRPLVASDAPGLAPVVKDAGILFPIGDTEALSEGIQKLLNDENHYQQIVKACGERAQVYSIETYIEKHMKVYKDVIG